MKGATANQSQGTGWGPLADQGQPSPAPPTSRTIKHTLMHSHNAPKPAAR